ncbi:MAG TPA: hypothetical protein VK849_00395 [Longimicrobiales bacterium]|nr:hypothetical protein [Longimicrobiales bacterium]
MNLLAIVLILVAAAFAAHYYQRLERERRTALEYLAAELGLRFDGSRDPSYHRRYAHGLFRRGRKRLAENTLHGTLSLGGRSCAVRMGDYRYTTGSGKNQRTHRLSYLVLHVPWVGTPDLLIRRERIGDKIGSGIGFDDIDFESEEFSRRFWVKASDRKHAYDVVHAGMMRFLLDGPQPHVEIVDDACLVLDGRDRWSPEEFRGWLAWAGAFFDLWPEHLTERYRERADVRGIL